jgi:hypothetical protein
MNDKVLAIFFSSQSNALAASAQLLLIPLQFEFDPRGRISPNAFSLFLMTISANLT